MHYPVDLVVHYFTLLLNHSPNHLILFYLVMQAVTTDGCQLTNYTGKKDGRTQVIETAAHFFPVLLS